VFSKSARLLFCVSVFSVAPAETALGQQVPLLSEDAYISVLTILPGEPLYSAFGHTAIRVRDDSMGIDAVYNFGTFDFDTDWFYLKFARGLLEYRLARNLFEDVYRAYSDERRPIIEQRLNLDPSQRQLAIAKLEENSFPENRHYRYAFFFDNCSTRPRDLIEELAGGRKLEPPSAGQETFRQLIEPYIAPRPWTHFVIDVLLGPATDHVAEPRDRLFLPDELMAALEVPLEGDVLVASSDTLFWPRGYERPRPSRFPGPLFFMTLLLAVGTVLLFVPGRDHRLVRNLDATVLFFSGLVGLAIAFLWFVSEHAVTRYNLNILWAVPLHLLAASLVVRSWGGRIMQVYFVGTAILAAGMLSVAGMVQQAIPAAAIVLTLLLLIRSVYLARQASHT
jgi:hypothetical protein